MSELAEKELVMLAQQGNDAAFEELIQTSLVKLKATIFKNYRLQPADLDDVLQIATIKVWRKIGTFRSESSFTTWFYIILRNEVLNFMNKRNEIVTHEISVSVMSNDSSPDYDILGVGTILEETAASLMEKRELLETYSYLIKQVLDELTPPYSQVIKLALEERKTYKEIAQELGIPIGTVMSRLFFARKKAQQLIIKYADKYSIQLANMG